MIYFVLYYYYFELFVIRFIKEQHASYFDIFIVVCLSWLGVVLGCYISFNTYYVYIFYFVCKFDLFL